MIGLILQLLNLGWFMLKNLKSLTAKKKKKGAFYQCILHWLTQQFWTIAIALEEEVVQMFGN